MNLRIQDACSLCYDGCSTITGTKNRVTAQIERYLLVHRYCHSLNLDGGDTIKNIPLLKDILDVA